MANRRMFSKAITNSARFLRMPATARLLYYDLGMAADDDGVAEAFAVLRMTGASEDDLKILITKKFVNLLDEEDLIVYLEDWRKNNQIRRDRYTPSLYKELLPAPAVNQTATRRQPDGNQTATNGEPMDYQRETSGKPSGNQTATNGEPMDYQRETSGKPSGNQRETQVSIGKDRLDQDSTGKYHSSTAGSEEEGGLGGETEPAPDSTPNVEKLVENYPREIITLPCRGSEHRMAIFDFDVAKWERCFPAVDVLSVLERIRDYLDQHPEHQKAGNGEILAYVERQLERASNRARRETAAPSNQRASPRDPAEVIQILRQGANA